MAWGYEAGKAKQARKGEQQDEREGIRGLKTEFLIADFEFRNEKSPHGDFNDFKRLNVFNG